MLLYYRRSSVFICGTNHIALGNGMTHSAVWSWATSAWLWKVKLTAWLRIINFTYANSLINIMWQMIKTYSLCRFYTDTTYPSPPVRPNPCPSDSWLSIGGNCYLNLNDRGRTWQQVLRCMLCAWLKLQTGWINVSNAKQQSTLSQYSQRFRARRHFLKTERANAVNQACMDRIVWQSGKTFSI